MSARAATAALLGARGAVERALDDLAPGSTVLVGCSGGPDSLALVGATSWVAERRGLVAEAVVVDHALQVDSSEVAEAAAEACRRLGMPARTLAVHVNAVGGPEAAAREARYAALESVALERSAAAVLLGHTRDDQAETVLLRLARGSGARSLSAMEARSGLWRRPFLSLPRAEVNIAAQELLSPLGLRAWADPHNEDPRFARVRVRRLLQELGDALGPGVMLGLARSAELLRADADALDALADDAYQRLVTRADDVTGAECADLLDLPSAVRTRVIRRACLECGCPSDALGYDHVRAVEALVVDWHGQGEVNLPGRVVAERTCGRLCLRTTPTPPDGVAGGS